VAWQLGDRSTAPISRASTTFLPTSLPGNPSTAGATNINHALPLGLAQARLPQTIIAMTERERNVSEIVPLWWNFALTD